MGPSFLGLNSAVIFGCCNTISTAAASMPSTLLTLPTANSLPVSLQPLLPPCAPLSPCAPVTHPFPPPSVTQSWQPLFPMPAPPRSCISGHPTLSHTSFSVHLSCQDPHPAHSRAPTGTAKKLEPHFPVTSFPAHPAFTSSEEQQDV